MTKGVPTNKNKMSLKTYYGMLSLERTFMVTVPTATEQGCSNFRVEDFKRLVADIYPSPPQEKHPREESEKEAFGQLVMGTSLKWVRMWEQLQGGVGGDYYQNTWYDCVKFLNNQ